MIDKTLNVMSHYPRTLNKAQQLALLSVFARDNPSAAVRDPNTGRVTQLNPAWRGAYKRFRKRVSIGRDYAMIRWAGMYLGIELDGYTHS